MSLLVISVAVLLIGLAAYIYQSFANAIHYAAKFGGPKAYPLIGNAARFSGKTPAEFLLELQKIIGEFGKCFRLWLGTDLLIVVTDAKKAEAVLSSQKYLDKASQYDFVRPWLGDGLLTSTGKKWHSRRKIITPTFHFKILEQFVEIFDQQSNVFVDQLKQMAVSGEDFDIFPKVTLCALDVICESAMGTKVNAQVNSDSEYVKAVKDMSTIAMQRVYNIWARYSFTFNLSKYAKMQAEALKVLHGYTDSVIRTRRKELANNNHTDTNENDLGIRKKTAFLDMLLQTTTVDGRPLSDLDIREEVDTFMFEGHDTTTSAISFLMGILAKRPDIQEKVYEEVCSVFGNDVTQPATLSMLNELNYLDLVIKETLRLYPSVPMFGRMMMENHEINGEVFPAGANVMIMPFFMGRDPDYFDNPLEFKPERFSAEISAEKSNPYRYVPFSAGPRNCIGQKFAIAEIKSLVTKVLRHYQLLPAKQTPPEMFIAELILRPEGGIPLRIKKRENMLTVFILSLITIAFVLLIVHRKLTNFHQLPGPPEWPVLGSSLEFVNLNSVAIFNLLRQYARVYGKAYKICFAYDYTLVFAKPEIAEQIVNTQSYASKSEDYDKVAEWVGNGLLISKGEKWFKRRKVLTPGFHFKILDSFARVFSEQSDVLCQQLATYGGAPVDIFPRLKLFTLDVLCETALGYSCHAQTENSFYPSAVEEIMSILYWRMFDLFAIYLFRLSTKYSRFKKLVQRTKQFTLGIIDERRKLLDKMISTESTEVDSDFGRKKMALLDILIQATVDGKSLSDEDIREEVDTFTFAGHDTTASALTFILFNIAKHSEVQQKLVDEVTAVVGSEQQELDLHTLNDLRYMDLVIKESLRLFPPVPLIARLATEDTSIENLNIPKGTCVCINIFEMHRDPEYFEAPERFMPDRFESLGEKVKCNPFTYIPFSAGNRNCIGQKYAQYELKAAVTKILQNFRLELPSSDYEPTLKAEIVLKPADRLPIRFVKRTL
ncbi:cytochrome P450 4d1-like [Sabethes cyaneus]|uniref:cytochrome P450 4d1-like n=1 Tax=Sabethes cyaneus TaxID=53552 RepID=UPI00237DD75B|nr:cytochrome P450 4d1-like [Sabethes cyaneus]